MSYVTTTPLLMETDAPLLTDTGEPLLIEQVEVSGIRFSPFDRFGEQRLFAMYGEQVAGHAATIADTIETQRAAAQTAFDTAMRENANVIGFLQTWNHEP